MSESRSELAKAKLQVMKAVPYVQKQSATGLKYTFAGEAAFVEKLHPAMVDAGLTICPEGMELAHHEVYTTGSGAKMNRAIVRATYRLTHAASGQSETIQTLGEGADSGDKAVNKAQTGAFKYALRQAFLIETGNDPDETPSDQLERAPRQQKQSPAPSAALADWQKFLAKFPTVDQLNAKLSELRALVEADRRAVLDFVGNHADAHGLDWDKAARKYVERATAGAST